MKVASVPASRSNNVPLYSLVQAGRGGGDLLHSALSHKEAPIMHGKGVSVSGFMVKRSQSHLQIRNHVRSVTRRVVTRALQ